MIPKHKILASWKEIEKSPLSCECDSLENATVIRDLLEKSDLFSKIVVAEKHEAKTESVLLCIDSHQLNLAWEFQVWARKRDVNTVICFSKSDFSLIREAYLELGLPHMVVKAGSSQKWNQLDFDLGLADFTRDEFDVIYTFLD